MRDRYLIEVDQKFEPIAKLTSDYYNVHKEEKAPPMHPEDLIPSTAGNRQRRIIEFRKARRRRQYEELKEEQRQREERAARRKGGN